ncbi:O-antigen ligase family protein [Litorivicinus sp.]|nr:O-antigen ligase family protein [Litorivicinus sp.]
MIYSRRKFPTESSGLLHYYSLYLFFVLFAASIFSCVFPAGVISVASWISVLLAIIVFERRIFLKLPLFGTVGSILFVYLTLSVLWSTNDFLRSLILLTEFRIYLFVPILAIALYKLKIPIISVIFIVYLVTAGALIASFGLAFSIIHIDNTNLSLGNRIFHAYVMSVFFIMNLSLFMEIKTPIFKIFFLLMGIATAYNIINVEIGRTGYLLIISLIVYFILFFFGGFKKWLYVGMFAVLVIIAYFGLDSFHDRVLVSFRNLESAVSNGDSTTSIGFRLEMYKHSFLVGLENFWMGVGVGDSEIVLQRLYDEKRIHALSDNVHSEHLNMWIVGGFVGWLGFILYISSIFIVGFQLRVKSEALSFFVIGFGLILFLSSFFNSVVKDFGEKHISIVVLATISCLYLRVMNGADNGVSRS